MVFQYAKEKSQPKIIIWMKNMKAIALLLAKKNSKREQ